jgi:hypothetical protein
MLVARSRPPVGGLAAVGRKCWRSFETPPVGGLAAVGRKCWRPSRWAPGDGQVQRVSPGRGAPCRGQPGWRGEVGRLLWFRGKRARNRGVRGSPTFPADRILRRWGPGMAGRSVRLGRGRDDETGGTVRLRPFRDGAREWPASAPCGERAGHGRCGAASGRPDGARRPAVRRGACPRAGPRSGGPRSGGPRSGGPRSGGPRSEGRPAGARRTAASRSGGAPDQRTAC